MDKPDVMFNQTFNHLRKNICKNLNKFFRNMYLHNLKLCFKFDKFLPFKNFIVILNINGCHEYILCISIKSPYTFLSHFMTVDEKYTFSIINS